jgi:hypothetical protein
MERDLRPRMISLYVDGLEDPQMDAPVLVVFAFHGCPQIRSYVERGQEGVREY